MTIFDDLWDGITSIPDIIVGTVTDPVGTIEDIITGVAGAASDIVTQVWAAVKDGPECIMCVGSPAYWKLVAEMRAAQKAGIIKNEAQCRAGRDKIAEILPALSVIPGVDLFWNCACKVAFSDKVSTESIAEATAVSTATFALSAEDQIKDVVSAESWGPARLDFLVRGRDNGVWHNCYSMATGWFPSQKDWSSLGGQIQQPPAIVSWGADRLDIFVCGSDRALWHKCYDGASGWYPSLKGWNSLGGQMLGGPSVVSWGKGYLHVVVRGIDGALHYKGFNQTEWTPWVCLGGQITGAPRMVSWAPGRLDIFARGSDGGCHHRAYDMKTGWTGWEALGGQITDSPSAVSWGLGRLDIVVRGSDGGCWHKCWDANAGGYYPPKTQWGSLGGKITGAPSIVSWGPGRFDIVVRGPAGGIWHKCYDQAKGWYPGQTEEWSPLGGNTMGSPTAVTWGPGHLAIVAKSKPQVGVNSAVLYKDYNEGKGWMKEWANLGGNIK